MLEELVGIDAGTTARLLGLFVPLVVAFITKKFASQGLKGFLNLVVSAVVGSTVYLVAEDGGYDWTGFVNGTLDTFIASIIAYYGFLKPSGIAGSVANATKNFGLGQPDMQTNDVGAESAGDVHNDRGAGEFELLVRVLVLVIVVVLVVYVIKALVGV